MRVLLDEHLPYRLRQLFAAPIEVITVGYQGWKGIKNGELLRKSPQTAIVLLLLCCTVSTAPAQNTVPAEDIAEKALAATVYLEMKDRNGKTLGIGSGFFVKSNLIATNSHVIEGAAKGSAKT